MSRFLSRLLGRPPKKASRWSRPLGFDSSHPVQRTEARRPELEALEARVQPAGIPTPSHVVIVMDENHAFSQIIGSSSAPYINSLASQGALMTQSFGIGHPSQPNYMHFFAGTNVFGSTTVNTNNHY